jgi:hypothetical protein
MVRGKFAGRRAEGFRVGRRCERGYLRDLFDNAMKVERAYKRNIGAMHGE